MKGHFPDLLADGLPNLEQVVLHPLLLGPRIPRFRDASPAILFDHGQGPAETIAEVVGQIGIDPLDQALFTELGIQTKNHLPQKEITDGIGPESVFELLGTDHVAQALGDLGLIQVPVAMDIQVTIRVRFRRLGA